MIRIFVLLIMLLSLATLASAESLSKRFQGYITSEFYQLLITSKWDQQARLICGDLAGRSGLKNGQLIELSPVKGENGKPISGAWIHRVPGYTCGKLRTFNILVEFGSKGPLPIILLPGNTLAAPLLQNDALAAALNACRLKVRECELPMVVDTVQAGPILGVDGGWVELWFFDACGKIVVITMMFSPDSQGGTSFQAR